jgi:Flp pilus assembly pilin Flp
MLRQLLNDEAGFIVSAELVLVATLLVLGLIVGMSQVQHAVVEELNDVAHAIGSLNQSYYFTGFKAAKGATNQVKSQTFGSAWKDTPDSCDHDCDISCELPQRECANPGQ